MPNLNNPGGGGSYTYVQSGAPDGPTEGETWYDTDADEGKVYTGSTWVLHTVTDHSELAGISSGDHHTKPTQTQNVNSRVVGGGSGFQPPILGTSNVAELGDMTEDFFSPVYAACDRIHLTNPYGASVSGTIFYQDGTTKAFDLAADTSAWFDTDGSKVIAHVGAADYHHVTGVEIVADDQHNHPI